jgi:acyl carrier protein
MTHLNQSIEDTLLQIGCKYLFPKDGDVLTLESNLIALGLDSMNTVQMLLDIEETFEITFPDDLLTYEVFTSLGTLMSAIQTLMEEKVSQ